MQKIEIATDEPLAAYLSRLSVTRGVPLWDFRIHGGIMARYNKKPGYYDHVSAVTGIKPAVLRHHDLVKIGGTIRALGMTFDLKDIWAKSARACPCCIGEDIERGTGRVEARPRLRFGWMLRTLGRCAIHGVPLAVVGPDYDRFTYGDFVGTLARHRGTHDADLAAAADLASDIYFQGRIEKAAAGGAGSGACVDTYVEASADDSMLNGAESRMLDEMPVPAALLVTEVIGGMELFGDRYKRTVASGEDRQAAVIAGFRITSSGYDGLREFLSKRDKNVWRASRRGHFKTLYGRLQELLASRTDDKGYRDVVRFVAEHAHSNHALGPEDAFLGCALPRRLHSIRTAEVTHGIHRMTLRSILDSAGLLPAGSGQTGDGRVVIAAETFDALIADWRDRLPAEEAKARFGISGAALDDIVRRGLVVEKDRDRRRRSRLRKASYLEFLERLEHLPRGFPEQGMRNLLDMTKIVNRSYGEIISLILDGTITKVVVDSRQGAEVGFDGIFVDPLAVKLAIQVAAPPGITFQCAERMLGTTTKTVKRLAATGLLKTVEAANPLHRVPQRYVSPSALEEFQDTYISLFEFAKARGQIAVVKKRLTAAGIMPVFEEPGSATFYRRDALPAVHD
ncbi:TniQ family protein [Pararhizobium sp. LjRoot235]|uniref:TniQ family protein n=1 Tax=Pararhizobium sp. LjRoot235 TaxID=3342291 RepID=UPI003ECED0DE